MRNRKLIISPQAGFGNRLRALCSAKVLGDLIGREVFHYWVNDEPNSDLPLINEVKKIDAEYFFDLRIPRWNGDVDICFSEWMPGDYWHQYQSTAQKQLKIGRTQRLTSINDILQCEDDVILIETSHALQLEGSTQSEWNLRMSQCYNRNFVLNEEWELIFQSLPNFDFGVSIRRGEFLSYFPESNTDIVEAARRINELKGSKIIFSDDEEFRRQLCEAIKNHFQINREGLQAIDHVMLQFLTLSKCKYVLGTKDSSFPFQASLFRNSNYQSI